MKKLFSIMICLFVLFGIAGIVSAENLESLVDLSVSSFTADGNSWVAGNQATEMVIATTTLKVLIKELDISCTPPTLGDTQVVTLWDGYQGNTMSSGTAVPIWQIQFLSTASVNGSNGQYIYQKSFGDSELEWLKADYGLFINKSNGFGTVKASVQYK